MTTTTTDGLSAESTTGAPVKLGLWLRFARRAVHNQLERLSIGSIRIIDRWEGSTTNFGPADDPDLQATVEVSNPAFYSAMVARGSVGVGEAWMDGHWTCQDLTRLVRVMIRNRDVLDGMDSGVAKLAQPLLRRLHARNANSVSGSRRNIAAHYDLGNDLFELFLDPTMTYSCGIFEHENATMEEASIAKVDRLCRKLELTPADHLLEIGTGWGAFAIHAAREFGCKVTTTTISKEQHAIAKQRIEAAGLSDRIELLLEDYRNLTGKYDKVVHCEMIEAVGADYLPGFVAQCSNLLKDDGAMAVQAILISDQHYETSVREVDFIKRYIFPGSFIPSTTAILNAVTNNTDLRLGHFEEIGPHYATTLAKWREDFVANLDRVHELGYDERFARMWEFYLSYCEGGFAERFLGVGQYVFTKPLHRGDPLLPTRDALVAGPAPREAATV